MSSRDHANRQRAESFGPVAERYDLIRPGYPAALIDDLMADQPRTALDVGCGTGKAARLLADRGVQVLGVEIDERMAAVARAHGIAVDTGAFEDWSSHERRFELVVCGQAWHWVDPVRGLAKVAAVLDPGGLFVPFWNFIELDPDVLAELDAVYRVSGTAVSPASVLRGGGEATIGPHQDGLDRSRRFASVERREYVWPARYSREQWLQLIATHSDHLTLPGGQLATLSAGIGAAVDRLGGWVRGHYRTTALFARLR